VRLVVCAQTHAHARRALCAPPRAPAQNEFKINPDLEDDEDEDEDEGDTTGSDAVEDARRRTIDEVGSNRRGSIRG
jgi:hypothetical protein